MGMGKWIGGVIGWMAGGPLGALAGFALGSMLDNGVEQGETLFGGNTSGGSNPGGYTNDPMAGERNSFLFSMLVMASYVICADGRIMHSEMEYVRGFLRTNFGEAAAVQGDQVLRRLFEQRKQMDARDPHAFRNTIRDCGRQMAAHMSYGQRLQLLTFLAGIAKADGTVTPDEVEALREVAAAMEMPAAEVDSVLSLGGASVDEAYRVLEVDPSATDDEVRKAYRRMALKHHPDKVASLGEDVQKAAEEKFKQIAEAYDRIRKARGMK